MTAVIGVIGPSRCGFLGRTPGMPEHPASDGMLATSARVQWFACFRQASLQIGDAVSGSNVGIRCHVNLFGMFRWSPIPSCDPVPCISRDRTRKQFWRRRCRWRLAGWRPRPAWRSAMTRKPPLWPSRCSLCCVTCRLPACANKDRDEGPAWPVVIDHWQDAQGTGARGRQQGQQAQRVRMQVECKAKRAFAPKLLQSVEAVCGLFTQLGATHRKAGEGQQERQ